MNEFDKSSVAFGLKRNEFDHLSDQDVKKLIRLIARISESSYRRGFQHGVVETGGECGMDSWKWRHEKSLDNSPWAMHPPKTTTSIERLMTEHGILDDIGLYRDT